MTTTRRAATRATFAVMVLAAVVGLASCGDDSVEVAGGEVLLEAVDEHGQAPFTDDAYAGADEDDTSAEEAEFAEAFDDIAGEQLDVAGSSASNDVATEGDAARLRTANGDLPGLYGGSGDNARCDRKLLEKFLESEPDKAKAWVGALNAGDDFRWLDEDGDERRRLSRRDIGAFLDSLTPLVLTRDTRVTNHGYEDGRAVQLQSVLQAGTAVLVDVWGIPRVKCACGNPLALPKAVKGSRVTYVGKRWKRFEPELTINITQSTTIIQIFIVRDPEDPGQGISQPAGEEPDEGEDAGPIDDASHGDDGHHDDETEHDDESAHDDGGEDSHDDEPAGEPELGAEVVLLDTGNIGGVRNGGAPVSFTLDVATMITNVTNYHWNDAQGAVPGKITITSAEGELMGSWAVTTTPGQGGVPNAYWIAEPGLILEPGTYTVSDTSPGTWATNDEAGGKGMTQVKGRPVS